MSKYRPAISYTEFKNSPVDDSDPDDAYIIPFWDSVKNVANIGTYTGTPEGPEAGAELVHETAIADPNNDVPFMKYMALIGRINGLYGIDSLGQRLSPSILHKIG